MHKTGAGANNLTMTSHGDRRALGFWWRWHRKAYKCRITTLNSRHYCNIYVSCTFNRGHVREVSRAAPRVSDQKDPPLLVPPPAQPGGPCLGGEGHCRAQHPHGALNVVQFKIREL